MSRKNSFTNQVYQLVKQVPKGKVVTYGWVAAKLGNPRTARAVGNALHVNPHKDVPCYRVVNQEGRLAPGFKEQRGKLLKEGIEFKDKKHVNLKRCLWQKSS